METQISKSKFKARALEYFRRVEKTGKPLIVTDHGKPVVQIVRYTDEQERNRQSLRNSVLYYEQPTEPVGLDDWEVLK